MWQSACITMVSRIYNIGTWKYSAIIVHKYHFNWTVLFYSILLYSELISVTYSTLGKNKFKGRKKIHFHVSAFSFYPTKNFKHNIKKMIIKDLKNHESNGTSEE